MEALRECALHVYLRLQAATLRVALLFFIVVQHDDTGDYGSGRQGGICGRAVLNRLRYGHPPARSLAHSLICRIRRCGVRGEQLPAIGQEVGTVVRRARINAKGATRLRALVGGPMDA
jgi:hypothetical protein